MMRGRTGVGMEVVCLNCVDVWMCGCGWVDFFVDVRADLFVQILKGMVCFRAMSWLWTKT
jgi:hypothetical protein